MNKKITYIGTHIHGNNFWVVPFTTPELVEDWRQLIAMNFYHDQIGPIPEELKTQKEIADSYFEIMGKREVDPEFFESSVNEIVDFVDFTAVKKKISLQTL